MEYFNFPDIQSRSTDDWLSITTNCRVLLINRSIAGLLLIVSQMIIINYLIISLPGHFQDINCSFFTVDFRSLVNIRCNVIVVSHPSLLELANLSYSWHLNCTISQYRHVSQCLRFQPKGFAANALKLSTREKTNNQSLQSD